MKKMIIILMMAIPLSIWAQGKSNGNDRVNPYINYEELRSIMEDEDLLLIDVRTSQEYQSGHIPGSVNIPYDTMPSAMPEDSMNKRIVVYCRSGNRSATARSILTRAGFTYVRDFGGVGNWQDSLE